jgi:DNA-binding NarL/FixJ family response regulator
VGESTLFEPYNDGRKTCRVLLYENNELIRAGIRTTLDACSDISVVAEAVPGSDIDALLKRSEPNVVVSEYCRKVFNPGGRLDRPKSAFANLPVVILCSTDGPELDDAVRVGARGLVLRSDAAEQLASAVREVAIGNAFLAPSVAGHVLDQLSIRLPTVDSATGKRLNQLTAREREVLRLIAIGLTTDEVADVLCRSRATVKSHISHLLAKLGLQDRAQAIALAYQVDLIRTNDPRSAPVDPEHHQLPPRVLPSPGTQ